MEWLSQNWLWLVFGIAVVVMMRRCARGGHGGCCGGGHGDDDKRPVKVASPTDSTADANAGQHPARYSAIE